MWFHQSPVGGADPIANAKRRRTAPTGAEGGQGEPSAASLEDHLLPVPTQLARWWRAKQRDPETFMDAELAPLLPTARPTSRFSATTDFHGGVTSTSSALRQPPMAPTDNPHTILLRVGRTQAARQMLRARADHYRRELAALGRRQEEGKLHRERLAGCLLWLGDAAGAAATLSTIADPSDAHTLLLELATRQRDADDTRRAFVDGLLSDSAPTHWRWTDVDRVPTPDVLSFAEFFERFASGNAGEGRPLLISGGADAIVGGPSNRWSLQMLREKAGDTLVEPKRCVADSASWARLEPVPGSARTLTAYIDALPDKISPSKHASDQHEYLFDFPLPIHRPELLEGLQIPRYFSQDFFQRTPEGSLYRDSWPSLFIGPPGSACALHIDANHTHFWMALFGEGSKEWILFPPGDTALLHPQWPPLGAVTRDAVFDIDPFDDWASQLRRYPSLAGKPLQRVVPLCLWLQD
jgi:hypothetical protein